MPMKLYAAPDNYKTQKALIAAKYVGCDVETPSGAAAAVAGKIPVLETDQGCIFSSNAIARYISRISRPVGLYGQNLLESGMIDSWMEFCSHEIEVPLCSWVYPIMGLSEENPEVTACAKEDVKRSLTVLNNHLLHNTFMVGHTITLADISICCALIDGMKLVLDKDFRGQFGNVMRWFEHCLKQTEFKQVLGDVKLCGGGGGDAKQAKGAAQDKAAKADKKDAAPKKEEAPKKEAAGKKDASPKKEAAPKKEPAAKKDAKGKDAKDAKGKGAKDAEAAPPTEEELKKMRADKLKKVKKEGGKRGVEIEGAADMGGLQFFCTSVDLPEGDLELLVESMKAMNEKSDPTEEERKGGSGHIGKMVFSAGVDQLAVVAYVPAEKQKELSCEEWLKTVLDTQGGKVQNKAKDLCSGFVKANSDKNIFPLKIREPMILEANNFLRKKGLFPEDNDDDDDYVFGDDDFPSM